MYTEGIASFKFIRLREDPSLSLTHLGYVNIAGSDSLPEGPLFFVPFHQKLAELLGSSIVKEAQKGCTTQVTEGKFQAAASSSSLNMSSKKELLSSSMKRTSEWIFSQEIPSDVTVHVGEVSFSLHKFPLVSKCGHIRKYVSESTDADVAAIKLPDIPGGPEAFELAAKFCYGINFEISTENIAMLRCVAEYLEMTEDYSVGNLIGRTEAYLNEVALKSLTGAVTVLSFSQNLLPIAEKVKLVGRCIDSIAFIACKDSQLCMSSSGRSEGGNRGLISSMANQQNPIVDWWAEDLTILRIDIFQRVLIAMMARGFKQFALGPVLMLYAQKSLRGLEMFGKGRKKIEPQQEHEKRVILETVVSLLPRKRNAISVSFLSMLLRAAIYLETTVACRLDLENRMGMQLEQAVLDDLLIPSYFFTGNTLFDVDTVQRIIVNYLEHEIDGNRSGGNGEEGYASPPTSNIERVGKLMENYLAEIAADRNLSVTRFINIAELIPEQSRVTEDGMYRAIDIYLKAHPSVSDMERKKVCGLMDCQRLSREACAHAAQNDRLPVQTIVQVLYYEQQRVRDVMNEAPMGADTPFIPAKVNDYSTDLHPVLDQLSILRRENEDLKVELVRMKMKMTDVNKSAVSSPLGNPPPSIVKHSVPRKSFITSVSKRLGKLYPFVRADGVAPADAKGRARPGKDRRHSIS